jgi:alkylated DNA repair dioxygenase AlkB
MAILISNKMSIIYDVLPESLQNCVTFSYLEDLQPTSQNEITIYGKTHKIPRYQQAYGKDYKFSNAVSKSLPIPEEFKPIIAYYSKLYNCKFNMMLINWYPNGSYYISPHSDDEKQIIENSPILSISYGATRKFVIEDKKTKEKSIYYLKNYDTLAMCDHFQKKYKHGIPKQLGVKDMRINLTFRCFHDNSYMHHNTNMKL